MKKKRLVITSKRAIKQNQDVSLDVLAIKNQITHLTAQVAQLAEVVAKQHYAIADLKFERPPVENIRVAPQKPIESEDGKQLSHFNKLVKATQLEVSKHLDSLAGTDLQDIVQSAISGKPIVEGKSVQHHPDGTQGKMTDWLNANIPVINTQDNIWNTIAESKQLSKERHGARIEEAKEFTKEWKNAVGLREALERADEGTCKTNDVLHNTSTSLVELIEDAQF